MPRAAIYVREPRPTDRSNISSDVQEAECRAYCAHHSLDPLITYMDASDSRDEFDSLIARATAPEAPYDAVVVWKTRIFTHSLDDTIKYRDLFRNHGVKLLLRHREEHLRLTPHLPV